MSYKKVLTGSLGLAVALGAFAAIGVAPSFAAVTDTTTVNVLINEECIIGGGSYTSGAGSITILLSASTPSGEESSDDIEGSAQPIQVTCNDPLGWTLTEQMNTGEDQILNIGGGTVTTTGFSPLASPVANIGAFPTTGNVWGSRYTGTDVVTGALSYRGVTANGTPYTIASNASITALSTVSQYFGASTDGTLGEGTYTGVVLYTLTGGSE